MSPAPPSADLRRAAPGLSAGLGLVLRGLAALIARAFLRDPRHVAIIVPLWNPLRGRSACSAKRSGSLTL